mmetsp:Transcript_60350/g.168614  ORF Transcript_60350/g.168614 Transcript_60350/m.168614 type:complete len:172 (+) Transcript_60350:74-589(+)
MPTGRVTNWNFPKPGKKNSEGYGFVRVDDERGSEAGDLFLYADDVKDSKLRSQAKLFGLKNGTKIQFKIKEPASSRKSRLAVDVEPLRDDEDCFASGGRRGGGGGGVYRSRSRGGGRNDCGSPPSRRDSPRRTGRADSREPPPRQRFDSRERGGVGPDIRGRGHPDSRGGY